MNNPPKPNNSFIRQLDVVSKWAECKTPQRQPEIQDENDPETKLNKQRKCDVRSVHFSKLSGSHFPNLATQKSPRASIWNTFSGRMVAVTVVSCRRLVRRRRRHDRYGYEPVKSVWLGSMQRRSFSITCASVLCLPHSHASNHRPSTYGNLTT